MLGQIEQTDGLVVGQTGIVGAFDDAGFHRGEDFGEVHHDGRGAQIREDLGFHARGGAELPLFQVIGARHRGGGGQRFLPVDPPADQLHAELVVKVLSLLLAAAVIEPRQLLVGRVIAAHDVAHELERGVLAGLVGTAGHVAVQNAVCGGIKGLHGCDDRRGVEHFDVDGTAGHRFDVFDKLGGEFARGLFGVVMRLDAQRDVLRGSRSGQRQYGGCSLKHGG